MTDAREQPQYLQIARVLRPHGVRGDMRVQVISSFPDRLRGLTKILLGPAQDSYRGSREGLKTYQVVKAHHDKNDLWLIHLRGIESREAADPLREMGLFVALTEAMPLEADEYYLFQLLGLDVFSTTGQYLGKLMSVLETGANDVYIVRGESYGEVLIPAIDGVLQQVDLASGKLIMNLPVGLLPEADAEAE